MMVDGVSITGPAAVSATDTSEIQKAAEEKDEELSTLEKSKEEAKIDTSSGKTSEDLKKEIKQLESEKSLNYKKMAKIEAEIKDLTDKVKENMLEAKELQEKAIEEHKEEADKVVEENIAAYVSANKEGGSGMTKEELQANISKAMPDSPNLAKALAAYVTASRELGEIDSLLDSLNGIILDTRGVELDLKNKTTEYEKTVQTEKAGESKKGCCDPIGFMKDGARYDFIIDDGSFDSTSDFLGADNNWASMEALDKDDDNVINASELKDAGIKMVKTVNGQKKVVDIADEFSEDFSIDLSTYQQGGSYDGISNADSDNDGIADQQLLGTYMIHIGDEDIKGYNTLDDDDYLTSEYGIAIGEKGPDMSTGLKEHDNFFNEYSKISQKLDGELKDGLASLGLAEATIDTIRQHARVVADQDANIFMQKMKAEAEEEQKAEDAKKAEEEAQKEAEEKARMETEEQAQQEAQTAQNADAEKADDAQSEAAEDPKVAAVEDIWKRNS